MKYLKFLLIFFPVAIVLKLLHAPQAFVFIAAGLSIIPLAGFMGEATETLAAKAGPQIGGLLNATFGNATELIIAIFAIKEGQLDVVKASLAGSIIGNILLVMGLSMFVGGLKHKVQRFNVKSTGNSATLLTFAVLGLSIPAVFLHSVDNGHMLSYESFSVVTAIVMMLIYLAGLFFTFVTHKDVMGIEHAEHVDAKWSVPVALGVLLGATVGIAVMSELLVTSIHGVSSAFGWNAMFIGIIVLAVIGNAAEHSTAVLMAWKNQMDVAIEIAVGSSLQIALFVAPACVFVSLLFGNPMSLVFNVYELAAIGGAVFIANIVSSDGESNWLEGLQLMGVYVILAVGFYFLPAAATAIQGAAGH